VTVPTTYYTRNQHVKLTEDVRGVVRGAVLDEEASCYESVHGETLDVEGGDHQPLPFGASVGKGGESEPGVERKEEESGNGEDVVVEAGEGEVRQGMLHSYSRQCGRKETCARQEKKHT